MYLIKLTSHLTILPNDIVLPDKINHRNERRNKSYLISTYIIKKNDKVVGRRIARLSCSGILSTN